MKEELKNKWPELLQEPVRYIDATPDDNYPIRILQAYLDNCNCKWSDNTIGDEPQNPLLKYMNELSDERAKILSKAITKLRI